ncbi:MAG TPA: hypothetical protein VKV05_14275 [Terriglobales bacterium]|nr:hypothetical protein [Terriglobales bacterium]
MADITAMHSNTVHRPVALVLKNEFMTTPDIREVAVCRLRNVATT